MSLTDHPSTKIENLTEVREERAGDETRAANSSRRPYQKPGFLVSQAFERQALSCAGCLNQSAAFPNFCAMRS